MRTHGAWSAAVLVVQFLSGGLAGAQTNSWTKSTSGYWEEPNWSLGALPAVSQSAIAITNAGFKAVAIGASTRNYPEALTISNLVISAPENLANLLLLNFAGPAWPLRVRDTFFLGNHCVLQSQYSGLQVGDFFQGRFLIGGTVYQGDFSEIGANTVYLGYGSRGEYHLSNGWFYANIMEVGGTNGSGLFNQEDGTSRIDYLVLHQQAEANLRGGQLSSIDMVVGEGEVFRPFTLTPVFTQWDGDLVLRHELIVGLHRYGVGNYLLKKGNLSSDTLCIGASPYATGFFQQSGGTNRTGMLVLSQGEYCPECLPDDYTYSTYHLSGGGLFTTRTTVGAGRAGIFRQSGGIHAVNGRLKISYGVDVSSYFLEGGVLSASHLWLDSGRFIQTGGTNSIEYSTINGASAYALRGGRLTSRSGEIGGHSLEPVFSQSGGVHVVSNRLSVSSSYDLSGGELVADELAVNGRFHYRGGVLAVSRQLIFSEGYWLAGANALDLPPLAVWINSTLAFSNSACVHQFSDSAGLDWYGRLTVENWQGSTNGGGVHQLRFGVGGGGLTTQQVAQIQFRNPAGFAFGLYPARLLGTGEVVPTVRPALKPLLAALRMVLQWEGGFALETATNVTGPYEVVFSASSPFTNQLAAPERYFRLRQ